MGRTRARLLIGCGTGCGVLILAALLAIGSGALWVRDLVGEFGSAVDLRDELDATHGTPRDWTPPADGRIPSARIEAFLAARERTADERARIAETMRTFSLSQQTLDQLEEASSLERMREVWRITGSAFDLAPGLGAYFTARNRALVEIEMGYGEYAYLYALGFWSFLSIAPDDGPPSVTPIDRADGDVVTIEVDGRDSSIGVQPQVLRRVRDDLRSMLDNQRAACDRAADCDTAWRDALAAELAVLDADRDRFPWPDGPPGPLAASLEPFRERLRASYVAATNPFELARNRKRSAWSVESE